jgi:hypothetical protein
VPEISDIIRSSFRPKISPSPLFQRGVTVLGETSLLIIGPFYRHAGENRHPGGFQISGFPVVAPNDSTNLADTILVLKLECAFVLQLLRDSFR